MANKRTNHKIHPSHKIHWNKEALLLLLAVLSISLLIYEELAHPSANATIIIDWFDFGVACIFLTDFIWLFVKAPNKKLYMKHNGYLLFASIPLVNTWTEVLRGLRILRFIKLVRVGEHLEYGIKQNGGVKNITKRL